MKKKLLLWVMALFLTLSSWMLWKCQSVDKDFSTLPTGLQYKFYDQHLDSTIVLSGDMVTADVVFKTHDTTFFVSSRDLTVPYQFEILSPCFPGDIYEAFLMMSKGDSATFILKGDSLFLRDFEIQELPEFIDSTTLVYMDVRLTDILPREQLLKEKEAYKERVSLMLKELKEKESSDIQHYLAQHDVTVKPTSSGLYYIELIRGNGPKVEPGKNVKINYSAMFINGEIFETTIQEAAMKYNIFDSLMVYLPFEFIQGDSAAIEGWNEGLSYMREGGKAKLIIPSALAYGEEGIEGYIPPYSPLLYEIEVLEVK